MKSYYNLIMTLFDTIDNNDLEQFKKLIETGDRQIDILVNNELLYATQKGRLEFVKYLIEKNFDINYLNNNKCNSLLYACNYGHFDIAEFLVENGINIKQKDRFGKDFFFYANRRKDGKKFIEWMKEK